jgi:hypothetical protein
MYCVRVFEITQSPSQVKFLSNVSSKVLVVYSCVETCTVPLVVKENWLSRILC